MKFLTLAAVATVFHHANVSASGTDAALSLVESNRRNLQTVFGSVDESTGNAGCVNDELGRDVCTLNFDIGFPGTERSVEFSLMLTCPAGWASDAASLADECSYCEVSVQGQLCNSCEICGSSTTGSQTVASARSAQPYAFNCKNVLNAEYTQAGIDCNGVSVGAGEGTERGDMSGAPVFWTAGLTVAVLTLPSLL